MFTVPATPVSRFDRLSVFAFIAAIVRLFHLISFPEWVSYDKRSYLLMVFVVLVLLRPQSLVFLILLLAASLLRTLNWMPFSPNHIFLEFWVDAAVLVSLLYSISLAYRDNVNVNHSQFRNQLFERFAPVARISILILYFYAVFHKLNWDYFNPDISCGTFLTQGLLARLHIFYLPYWAKWVAIWGTLLIETLIPLLFVFGATRRWSILLGLVFHFILAIHPHPGLYSFSSLLIGFFYLFTPPAFNAYLASEFGNWQDQLKQPRYRMGALLVIAVIIFCWVYQFGQGGFHEAAFVFWYVWWLFVFLVYVRFLVRSQVTELTFSETFAIRPRMLWVFVVILFGNGLLPYLGLKTQTSYSMFSNLRTEGGMTNHVFMPRGILTSHWQDDLVAIQRTNVPELEEFQDGKRMITYFELKRTVSNTSKDFFVDYQRGGKSYHLQVNHGLSNDPKLTQPYSWLTKKAMRFRPVYTDACLCQH